MDGSLRLLACAVAPAALGVYTNHLFVLRVYGSASVYDAVCDAAAFAAFALFHVILQ
jgi:hypothetical protein